jgi:hypothetical protein
MLLQLLKNVNRNAAHQRKEMKIAKVLPIAAWKCSQRLLDIHWALLEGYKRLLGNVQRLLDNHRAILNPN